MNIKRCKLIITAVVLSQFIFFSGCKTGLRSEINPELNQAKTLAVFPFISMAGSHDDPLGHERVQENASSAMTEHLVTALRSKTNLSVRLQPELSPEDLKTLNSGSLPENWAVSGDAVLIGRLFYFRDRKGGNYAVSDPSKVAFDVKIIGIPDGKVLYYGEFAETQKPLLSNMMTLKTFFKRKGRWVTAEEMAFSALDEIIEDFVGKNP